MQQKPANQNESLIVPSFVKSELTMSFDRWQARPIAEGDVVVAYSVCLFGAGTLSLSPTPSIVPESAESGADHHCARWPVQLQVWDVSAQRHDRQGVWPQGAFLPFFSVASVLL